MEGHNSYKSRCGLLDTCTIPLHDYDPRTSFISIILLCIHVHVNVNVHVHVNVHVYVHVRVHVDLPGI